MPLGEAGLRCDFLADGLHVFASERRDQRAELVDEAAERPDVRAEVVGLVFPDFRRSVVGRACLGEEELALRDLRDVHVSDHRDGLVFAEEDVGAFDVSVDDVVVVQELEALRDLVQVLPDELLGQEGPLFAALLDELVEVPAFCVVRHDAELRCQLVEEGFAEGSSAEAYR